MRVRLRAQSMPSGETEEVVQGPCSPASIRRCHRKKDSVEQPINDPVLESIRNQTQLTYDAGVELARVGFARVL